MSGKQEPAGGPSKSLAPLSSELTTAERAFAEHLRELRDQTGLTLAALAQGLKTLDTSLSVDPTRLSRFLSGQSLPSPQLLTTLHRLLDDLGTVVYSPEAVKDSRSLLYASAHSKGPLSARAYEIEEMREKLEEQRSTTARELEALQEALSAERLHRQQAEKELNELRATATEDHSEDVRRLLLERDTALQRVKELEDLIAQTRALLRLSDDDAWHLEEMSRATHSELARWEVTPAAVHEAHESNFEQLGPSDFVELMARLRDEGRDELGTRVLARTARNLPPGAAATRYGALIDAGRVRDADRLLQAAVRHCDGVRLRHLAIASTGRQYPSLLPEGFVSAEKGEILLGEYLLPVAGSSSPPSEVARMARAFLERSEYQFLSSLLWHAAERSSQELYELRRMGVPAGRWWLRMEKRSFLRVGWPRLHVLDCDVATRTHEEELLNIIELREKITRYIGGCNSCTDCAHKFDVEDLGSLVSTFVRDDPTALFPRNGR